VGGVEEEAAEEGAGEGAGEGEAEEDLMYKGRAVQVLEG
jgi:hypothetical protein